MRQPRHLFIFKLTGDFKKSDGSNFSDSPCLICEHIGIQSSRNPLPEIPDLPVVPKLGDKATKTEKANQKAIQDKHDKMAEVRKERQSLHDEMSRKYQVNVMLKCFDGKKAYDNNSNNVDIDIELPSVVYVDTFTIDAIKKELIKSVKNATGATVTEA